MYDKEKLHEDCIRIVKEEKLTFFSDLTIYIEPTLSTLYEWEFEKSEDIKKELAKNKLAIKKKMRNKWELSDNPALQLAAYKLVAEKSELDALTMNKVESSGSLTINWTEEKTYEADNKTNESS